MMSPVDDRLPRASFEPGAPHVARALLGQRLMRRLPDGTLLSGRIVETEAYHGLEDSASHGRSGPSGRARIMFGRAGHAYIYLIYGMYDMLNISTGDDGTPSAVLVRAVEPLAGVERMLQLRPTQKRNLTNGPGKLCQALAIGRELNGIDMVTSNELWIAPGMRVEDDEVATTPRIGIDYADPDYRARPWRFIVKGNRWVSR